MVPAELMLAWALSRLLQGSSIVFGKVYLMHTLWSFLLITELTQLFMLPIFLTFMHYYLIYLAQGGDLGLLFIPAWY